jgi:hypothetical protein
MARQNNRNPRDRRNDGQKRDAAGSSLRVHSMNRDTRDSNERERQVRHNSLSRYEWNDLYERSSI